MQGGRCRRRSRGGGSRRCGCRCRRGRGSRRGRWSGRGRGGRSGGRSGCCGAIGNGDSFTHCAIKHRSTCPIIASTGKRVCTTGATRRVPTPSTGRRGAGNLLHSIQAYIHPRICVKCISTSHINGATNRRVCCRGREVNATSRCWRWVWRGGRSGRWSGSGCGCRGLVVARIRRILKQHQQNQRC